MVGVVLLALLISANVDKTKGKAVKIVEEPAVYRGINTYYQQRQASLEKRIVARVKEKPFTGPSYFKSLDGKCFVLQQNGYKYELCPFHNVTQKEESSRWNAFSGVLGVWKEWVIVNNTFQAMLLTEGDLCQGNTPRETKVFLKCGEENKLVSVKEPNICKYDLVFHTPLACPLDSLLVFPALSPDEQNEWLNIEKEMYHQELTVQGYNKRRRKLFMEAGFLPKDDTEAQKEAAQRPKGEFENRKGQAEGMGSTESLGFHSLQHCSKAYKELKDEVQKLRKLINITKGTAFESESHKPVEMQRITYRDKSLKTVQEESYKNESHIILQTQLHKNELRGTALEKIDRKETNRTVKDLPHRNELHKKGKTEKKESHKTQTVVSSVAPENDAQVKNEFRKYTQGKAGRTMSTINAADDKDEM